MAYSVPSALKGVHPQVSGVSLSQIISAVGPRVSARSQLPESHLIFVPRHDFLPGMSLKPLIFFLLRFILSNSFYVPAVFSQMCT